MSEFVTLAAPSEHREDVKGSVFIAYAERAETPEQALDFLRGVAARHADASHLCWAYSIGLNYRFSDGGEPGGTAGQPIFRAIEGQGLDQVVVGVIRYFGGTKLGAGGLVRAYGGVAAEALRKAGKRRESPQTGVRVRVRFEHIGSLYHVLDVLGVPDRQERYDETGLELHAMLPRADVERLATLLRDATRDDFVLETREPDARNL